MSTTARLKDTVRHEAGALDERFGIVTGTVEQFADTLDVEPDEVPAAIEAAAVDLLNDTARRKPRETHSRPDDPALRSLAMTRKAFARLLASPACGTPDHDPRGQVAPADAADPLPTETEPMPATRDKTENLKVRVSPDLMQHLEAAAERDGRTVSGFVRHTLKRQLDIERRVFGPKKEPA